MTFFMHTFFSKLTVNMGNLTQEKDIIHYLHEKDDFEHPLSIKIALGFFSVLTIASLFVINRRLFIFLRRPNRRCIDQIVHFQYTITHIVTILAILFFNLIIWTKLGRCDLYYRGWMLLRLLYFLLCGSIWKCPLLFHCPFPIRLHKSSKQII